MDVAAARQERPRRSWSGFLERRRVLAVVLIAPAIIYVAVVVGVPFGWAIYLSFTDAISGSLTGNWVGFDNFTDVWSDPNFQTALQNTLIVTLASLAIVVIAAAILSHYLVRDFREVVRALPRDPAVGRTGRALDDRLALDVRLALQHRQLDAEGAAPRRPGLLDVRRRGLRRGQPAAVARPREHGLVAIIIVNAWRVLPFAVIFIAGLASIPTEVEDAAKIDGATG